MPIIPDRGTRMRIRRFGRASVRLLETGDGGLEHRLVRVPLALRGGQVDRVLTSTLLAESEVQRAEGGAGALEGELPQGGVLARGGLGAQHAHTVVTVDLLLGLRFQFDPVLVRVGAAEVQRADLEADLARRV